MHHDTKDHWTIRNGGQRAGVVRRKGDKKRNERQLRRPSGYLEALPASAMKNSSDCSPGTGGRIQGVWPLAKDARPERLRSNPIR